MIDGRSNENDQHIDVALIMCPAWGIVQPPVSISYLKSYLAGHGFTARCFDFSLDFYRFYPQKEYWDLNFPEHFIYPRLFQKEVTMLIEPFIAIWAKNILKYNPRLVGFSLYMSSRSASILLARKLKRENPGLIIVGGGAEVSRIKKVLIDGLTATSPVTEEIFEYFDCLINGEGEDTLLNLLQCIRAKKDFHALGNLILKENGSLSATPQREPRQHLDHLMSPDFSDFSLPHYKSVSLPIITSRGCVNRCTFCADASLWRSYRTRSAQNVVSDMKTLARRYGINRFEIIDSTFNGDMKRLKEICELLIDSHLHAKWSAKVTLNKDLTFEFLKTMRAAGCRSLAYGVESASPRVLKDMRKNIEIDMVKRILRDTHRAGIQANCFFIIGYPTEEEEDFQMTLDFIKENAECIHECSQTTGCHIEEDSYLGRNMEKYGIVFKEDGWHSAVSTPAARLERIRRFKNLVRDVHRHYQCEVQS